MDTPPFRLIGVIHLTATPGTYGFVRGQEHPLGVMLAAAVRDAEAFVAGGVSELIVENFHDAPFLKTSVAPETVAALTLAVDRVARVQGVTATGVNVLRNDARSGLGIAAATGAEFIRVNVHTGAMFTDQGLIEGDAAGTIRERARLDPSLKIYSDVHVKHATPVAGENLVDAARDAVLRGRADGLVVSGAATGSAPSAERVKIVREAVGSEVEILIGSGFRLENAASLRAFADGAIVGTAAKLGGRVENPVDAARVSALVESAS